MHNAHPQRHVLVQSVPGRMAMDTAMTIPPGLWITIIGMLSAPTSLRW